MHTGHDRSLEQRVVFIGGSPRSVTTLVQNILDCHPSILGGPEFLHLPDIFKLRKKLLESIAKEWISLICSREDVDTQIRGMIGNFLLAFADRHDAGLLSEKTPENVLVFPDLVDLLPEAKLIHVVRDPRAIVASLLGVSRRAREMGETPAPFTANIDAAVEHVRRCMKSGFATSQQAPDQVFTVVYEQLVSQPEQIGRRLCDFLGIEWHPAMSTPGEQKHLGEAAITANSKEIWYDAKTYYSNPNTDSLDKWRRQLSGADQMIIARGFASMPQLQALGYDLTPGHLSAADRARAGATFMARRVGTALIRGLQRITS